MYREEKKLGETGMQIGMKYPDSDENPEFAKLHRSFKIWHIISNVVNCVGMAGNTVYIYYLASSVRI